MLIRFARTGGGLLLGALLLGGGATARAQTPSSSGGSIFFLLPSNGRLEVGSEVRGGLSAADYRGPNDAHLDAWELEGRVGDAVTVDLIASDLDGYLYVVGPGFGETLSDDDGGAGCNARLSFTFLESGTFRVVASSTAGSRTGVYTIRVSAQPEPIDEYGCGEQNPAALRELPTGDRRVTVGESVTGTLSNADPMMPGSDRRVQAWALDGMAGQTVTITLTSAAFDSYLYVVGPGIGVQSDDDSAGELNAQLTVTFPESGAYRIIATSVSSGASGAYTLDVRRQ
jgi:serine protease Do